MDPWTSGFLVGWACGVAGYHFGRKLGLIHKKKIKLKRSDRK